MTKGEIIMWPSGPQENNMKTRIGILISLTLFAISCSSNDSQSTAGGMMATAGVTTRGCTQAGGTQAGGAQAGGTQAGGTQAGGIQAGGTQAGT